MRLGLVALVVLEVDLELDSGQLCWEVLRPKLVPTSVSRS